MLISLFFLSILVIHEHISKYVLCHILRLYNIWKCILQYILQYMTVYLFFPLIFDIHQHISKYILCHILVIYNIWKCILQYMIIYLFITLILDIHQHILLTKLSNFEVGDHTKNVKFLKFEIFGTAGLKFRQKGFFDSHYKL